MRASVHDVYPKPDLDGNYLGDGYPLCSGLPSHVFLGKGARYVFLGYSYDGSDAMTASKGSQLYVALCGRSTTNCDFAVTIELEDALQCQGTECNVGIPKAVRVASGYYEYVPPSCVHLFFSSGVDVAVHASGKVSAQTNAKTQRHQIAVRW